MSTSSVSMLSASTSTVDNHKLHVMAYAALMPQEEKASAAEVVAAAEALFSFNKSLDFCKPFWETTIKPSTAKENAPKNANGRTPLPLAPSERRLQSSKPAAMSETATKSSAASQDAFQPERAAEPKRETKLETAPAYVAVPQHTLQAPSEEAVEPELKKAAEKKDRVPCFCSKCNGRRKPVSQHTITEHARAEEYRRNGEEKIDKCEKCRKFDRPCVAVGDGPCSSCIWIKEKCPRDHGIAPPDGNVLGQSTEVMVGETQQKATKPKQAKGKALEPMEGPKKAQKLTGGRRLTFAENVKVEPRQPSLSPYSVKAIDGGNNIPVVGAPPNPCMWTAVNS
ncbi:hypothetical protein CGCF415_v010922 [Colletotrichum fructicola]|nr:hypothetical protein CFRS1_v014077 [Colletotrichum fructicola]KAF4889640.1 hypothetical protein CGCFRS4_v009233 [Colletotrichum fructicola]KAF4898071.1 hypothetical protein CGCF415_v010922 [Colletotrichum fructicola]KAF4931429.1 hypothetical protein CGCF245_v011159 [Colletotrichum fructicola]